MINYIKVYIMWSIVGLLGLYYLFITYMPTINIYLKNNKKIIIKHIVRDKYGCVINDKYTIDDNLCNNMLPYSKYRVFYKHYLYLEHNRYTRVITSIDVL